MMTDAVETDESGYLVDRGLLAQAVADPLLTRNAIALLVIAKRGELSPEIDQWASLVIERVLNNLSKRGSHDQI